MISQKWFSYFELRSRKSDLNNLLKIILIITIRGHSQRTTGRPERDESHPWMSDGGGRIGFRTDGGEITTGFSKMFLVLT